jgi:hypothetical protein
MIARVAMLALLAAVAFGAAVPKKMVGLSGSSTSCVNGKVHSLKYNTCVQPHLTHPVQIFTCPAFNANHQSTTALALISMP